MLRGSATRTALALGSGAPDPPLDTPRSLPPFAAAAVVGLLLALAGSGAAGLWAGLLASGLIAAPPGYPHPLPSTPLAPAAGWGRFRGSVPTPGFLFFAFQFGADGVVIKSL